MTNTEQADDVCPKCAGERYDTSYEGYPAEDGGPGPCVLCNGSGARTPRSREFHGTNCTPANRPPWEICDRCKEGDHDGCTVRESDDECCCGA